MNRRPSDIDARLAAWLEEGPTSGPEEVLSRTFARARSTRQDRVWLHRLTLPMRSHAMNTTLKFATIAVLVLAVGIAIGPFQPRSPNAAANPSPSPVASPTAPLLLPMSFGPLDAGTYALGSPDGPLDSPLDRMTATVPEGWQGIRGSTFANLFQTSDEFPAGSISLSLPDNFFIDPCDTAKGLLDPPLGPTVDDFVTALAEVPGYTTTDPTDVEFLGYTGKYIEEVGPPSVTQCADGFSHPWQTKFNETAPYDVDDQHARLWILDIDGVRLVITLVDSDAAPHPTGTDPADLAQQQAVFDSLRIVPAPRPAASPSGSPGM